MKSFVGVSFLMWMVPSVAFSSITYLGKADGVGVEKLPAIICVNSRDALIIALEGVASETRRLQSDLKLEADDLEASAPAVDRPNGWNSVCVTINRAKRDLRKVVENRPKVESVGKDDLDLMYNKAH